MTTGAKAETSHLKEHVKPTGAQARTCEPVRRGNVSLRTTAHGEGASREERTRERIRYPVALMSRMWMHAMDFRYLRGGNALPQMGT
ncbi:uncharacterized protein N7487_000942 [Penicillium crustosum]|uniref:uncharacterized protein n=1 Tax=Penicillium crustosum TaxID=36656 RepID=UPI0023A16B3A|nr:uncharacterized protein N7487_000942 [Penicillium crustosum]KAJ5417392.1 hypothetical protein N7487_000942 [Penicillium crustosum]